MNFPSDTRLAHSFSGCRKTTKKGETTSSDINDLKVGILFSSSQTSMNNKSINTCWFFRQTWFNSIFLAQITLITVNIWLRLTLFLKSRNNIIQCKQKRNWTWMCYLQNNISLRYSLKLHINKNEQDTIIRYEGLSTSYGTT